MEDDRHRYTWNGENRLVRVESKDGATRVEYAYDYQGRRVTRVETRNAGTEDEVTRATAYLYDGWNVLAELTSQETADQSLRATYYTWGRDLSGSLQGAGGVGGLLAMSEDGEHRYPTYDANGNVGQLLDARGEVMAGYLYDPYGNVMEMRGEEAMENPWRFSTKPADEVTGWSYYGFRWYDPRKGRWPNRDPIEEVGGTNLYGFVENQAVNTYDILGLYEPAGDGTDRFVDPAGRPIDPDPSSTYRRQNPAGLPQLPSFFDECKLIECREPCFACCTAGLTAGKAYLATSLARQIRLCRRLRHPAAIAACASAATAWNVRQTAKLAMASADCIKECETKP